MIEYCIETHLFVAVKCKKPWDFLALTIFRAGRARVVFTLAGSGSGSLTFEKEKYIKIFGRKAGMSLYSKIAEELKACRDASISTETIRMKLCIVIWEQFGAKWLETFSSNQESRRVQPPEGELVIFNFYALCEHLLSESV